MTRYFFVSWTLASLLCLNLRAKAETPATLEIDTENITIYRQDVFDATRVATDPSPTVPLPLRSFMNVFWIGDVVAVNGVRVKGTLTVRGTFINLNPNPTPGVGIGDTANSLASEWIFDIQRADGTPVGTIVASGWAFGARAAGFPSPGQGNLAVTGGTGAFFGIRGQGKETSVTAGPHAFASVTEDPANRRVHGGRGSRHTFHVIPLVRPEIAATSGGPGIFHADFAPVTPGNPARRGELLIVAAANLGPTLPGKQPGDVFAADPLQPVAAPIQVLVNGTAVGASNQVGWPGTAGTYRVDFRVPEETTPGVAKVQLVAGWIPGLVVEIPLR
jgi:hypothetical protein